MVILGMILRLVIPLVLPVIIDDIRQGKDPSKRDWVDWAKHYGRSTEELEAEVDTKKGA